MKVDLIALTAELGPRAQDLVEGVEGSMTKVLRHQFTNWARAYADRDALFLDALAEAVIELQKDGFEGIPVGVPLHEYINIGIRRALAEHRRMVKTTRGGLSREVPWDPIINDNDTEPGDPSGRGFTVFEENQFVGNIKDVDHDAKPLPVDLSLLNEMEIDVLEMLAAGWTQYDVAVECGWSPDTVKTDHRGFIQNHLTRIRRKLCDGASTQQAARDWLERSGA